VVLTRGRAPADTTGRSNPEVGRAPGRDNGAPGRSPTWGERAWWTVAGLVLIEWSIRMYGSATTFPWVVVLVVVAGGWGLATAAASWMPTDRWPRLGPCRTAWGWATAVLVVGCLGVWAFLQVHAQPGYATDEIAFDQYAATLANHGINPYLHSMAHSFLLYRVPPSGFTYTLTGQAVTQLSYPALSFELYAPFVAVGWTTQLAIALNVAALSASILLLFVLLPERLRAAALVIGSLTTFAAYSVGGVTDVLYLPLLLGAAYRWNRFADQSGWRRWLGPVLLGLAMAIKQTPWVLLPFLVVAVALEARAGGRARALRTGAAYAGAALVGFAVPNIGYVVMAPRAWLHGILIPIDAHTVPAGQGAVGLSVFLGLGGGSLGAYTVLTVTVLVASLAVYATTYPVLRPVTFLLPSFVLFFAARSFGSYLVTLVPVALLAAVTTSDAVTPSDAATAGTASNGAGGSGPAARPWRHWPWVAGLSGAAVVMALVVVLASSPPLEVQIVGLRTTGQLATVGRLTVRVTNHSSSALRPAFTVDEGGNFTTFWPATGGPAVLGAGRRATYTLRAPNFFSQAPIGGGFQVVAFTGHPATVSTSGAYVPATAHVGLSPDAVNTPVPVGMTVTVRAQLLDNFDRPIVRAGIPVYLGQVIYDQRGLILSEAVVNGRPPGQTPVAALTGAEGVAVFHIVGTQATPDPVSFEANLVNPTQFYPYGYSEILPIQFSQP